jgi:dUTPase
VPVLYIGHKTRRNSTEVLKNLITRGMRIAQLVVAKYEKITWNDVDEFSATGRGAAGFGSSGQ